MTKISMAPLESRLVSLNRQLSDYRGMVIAFSGGADSAFLLAAAARSDAHVVAATSRTNTGS